MACVLVMAELGTAEQCLGKGGWLLWSGRVGVGVCCVSHWCIKMHGAYVLWFRQLGGGGDGIH